MNGVVRIDLGMRCTGKGMFCRICGKPARKLHRTNHRGLVCRRCDRREFQEVLNAGSDREAQQQPPWFQELECGPQDAQGQGDAPDEPLAVAQDDRADSARSREAA